MKLDIARVSAAIAVLCLAGGSVATAEGQTVVRTFGIGREPCASFLSAPQNLFQGSVWMLGYWTALNVVGAKELHMVGEHAQAEEIVADVKKACAAEPKTTLYGAIDHVYERYQKEGK